MTNVVSVRFFGFYTDADPVGDDFIIPRYMIIRFRKKEYYFA